MKLLNRDEFLKLPAGTLYTKYTDGFFEHINVKHDTNEKSGDFYSLPLIQTIAEDGDGFFDDDQFFAVFEAKELSRMTQVLQIALKLAINRESDASTITP